MTLQQAMAPSQHRQCPAHGCERRIPSNQVFCRAHWFQTPKPLRDEIWRLYQEARGSAAHLAAIDEAIQFVNGEIPA